MNQKIVWVAVCGGVMLAGCAVNAPSSLRPGLYSAATGLPHYASERISSEQVNAVLLQPQGVPTPNPAPFPDYDVVKFAPNRKLCQDTFRVPDLSKVNGVLGPGVVVFSLTGLAIDEAEITNLDWRLFVADVFPADSSSADALATVMPDSRALPVKDYYTSPFYACYPVVGISYAQARLFCEWRSQVINRELARAHDKQLVGVTCEYRLPTEAEWEEAAGGQSGQPYGTTCTQLPVRVAEGAAAYLQKRSAVSIPVAQIKADIMAYNQQRPIRSWINYAQVEPYFLRLATPSYVWQGPPNDFGLYQMLGNVAEMVEERGLTKGGSYLDDLAACRIKAQGHVDGPSPSVGFRAVCIMHRAVPTVK